MQSYYIKLKKNCIYNIVDMYVMGTKLVIYIATKINILNHFFRLR